MHADVHATGHRLTATRAGRIARELRIHAPFTFGGTVVGILIIVALVYLHVPRPVSATLFWITHPAHVLLSALVTTGLYRLHGSRRLFPTVVVGYVGSVGVATVSDSVIPHLGELLVGLEHAHAHIGFIEKWWLVNPLALAGIALACLWPRTKVPHAGHVLLSTLASLFHVAMATGQTIGLGQALAIGAFLFLAVWVPCCTSDIVFPLLFVRPGAKAENPPAQTRADA